MKRPPQLMLLSKIMELAFEEGVVDLNPVRRVPKEVEGEGRERVLSIEGEERLLPHLTGRQSYLYAPIVILIDAGLRIYSELFKLEVPHCNFGKESLFFKINGRDVEVQPNHLLIIKSKNKKPRCVPLTARARQALRSVIQDRTEGLVFSSYRTGASYKAIERGFKIACELAEIPYGQTVPNGLTLHSLRHTFASRLSERNVPLTVIRDLLGHSTVKMTGIYTHSSDEAKQKAIRRLSQKGEILEFREKRVRQNPAIEEKEAQAGLANNRQVLTEKEKACLSDRLSGELIGLAVRPLT
jgi:integrase